VTECDVVIDLQFGSTGKGLIAGVLAKLNGYDTVINANMPNAGHTFIDDSGREWIHKVLPNGIVGENVKKVMLGPGSIFDLDRLSKEIHNSRDILEGKTIYVHEDAMVLDSFHKDIEKSSLSNISSTMQGSSAAMIEKIHRDPSNDNRVKSVFKSTHIAGIPVLPISNSQWLSEVYGSDYMMIEGAQGFSLGLNAGFWPYCTSRDCTPARFMSDCAVPLKMLRRVIGCARTYPIRGGNTSDGYSGGHYSDQREVSWEDLGVEPETTTVTGRVRRVFTFSKEQITEAVKMCQPDEVFLNFANYCPDNVGHIISAIEEAQQEYVPGGGSVRFVGFGPKEGDVRIRHFLNPCDYSTSEMDKGWVQ